MPEQVLVISFRLTSDELSAIKQYPDRSLTANLAPSRPGEVARAFRKRVNTWKRKHQGVSNVAVRGHVYSRKGKIVTCEVTFSYSQRA